MLTLIVQHIRQKKWIYILIAITLVMYDASLVIPTRIIQGLVDLMSRHQLSSAALVRHVVILLATAVVSYGVAYLWHLHLFQEAVHFKFDIQQRAFRKLVFMRTPFYEKFRSGDMITRFSTDVEALMDLIGYGLMIVLYAGGMIAFIIPTMFLISWKMTLIGIVPILLIMVGLQLIASSEVTLGQVIALQLYLVSLVEPFGMLSDFILVYQTGKLSFGKINELIETSDDMEPDGQHELESFDQIAFIDYSFTYANSSRPSLEKINLTLKKGQTLGIVGKTGSGKTTLIRQFLRQYPLGQGQLMINHRSALAFKRQSLERQIGYVPQEHILFSKTVAQNIAMGKKAATTEEILEAIETAAFTRDIQGMAKGLDTEIGERGLSISGGQKQRISIARAFLSQPDLLILDDSLSAVDARTETDIIRHIQDERKGKTTLIVSHRLSAIQHADWVIVLDQGQIVEEGQPQQLLAQKGWYYEQYQRQQAQEV